MRRSILLVLLVYLIASCQWSPERDNPYDPNSIGYSEPLFNSPPSIDTFYATTHFWESNLDPKSEFELICVVSDIDNNFPPAPQFPVYFKDDLLLGFMMSDPTRQLFMYRGLRDDLPTSPGEDKFTVYIEDDSAATATEDVTISNWARGICPELVYPPPEEDPRTRMVGPVPRISWLRPSGEDLSHFKITLKLQGHFDTWDTVGISIDDTVAFLPLDEVEDATYHPEHWYAIYLTLYNNRGNSCTGRPGFFYYFYSASQTDESYREENDY